MNSQFLNLITESKSDIELITESYDPQKPKTVKFRGIFLQSEKKNGNDRIYPYDELKSEVDKYIEDRINTNRALMELEHPASCDINPDRACARILSLTEDNKQWLGEAVILCSDPKFGIIGTKCGDVVCSLLQYGTNLGASSRAVGQVDEKTGIVKDLHLVTIDLVWDPSIGEMCGTNANRFVDGILESKAFMIDNHGMLVESTYSKFEKRIKKLPNTMISEKKAQYLGNSIHEFFESLLK